MPPRRLAKKRSRPNSEDTAAAVTKKPRTAQPAEGANTPDGLNTSGLLSLPVEVFEIIYDLLLENVRLISREEVMANQPHLDSTFTYRTDVLLPLTQTCHALRAACLPRYHEHIEACICRTGRVWYKQLSERLEKTSLFLQDYPSLAQHVRTMTVSLTRCSTDTVLPAFAACLKALPNLHTLRVMHAHSQMTTALKNAFEKITLPQIQTLILPSCAHNILRSCPNVKDLTCNEEDGSKLISAMAKSSRNVEVAEGFILYEALTKRLAKAAPKLREIKLNGGNTNVVPYLEKIKLLSTIHLLIRVEADKEEDVEKNLQEQMTKLPACVDEARNILARNVAKGRKTLHVTFHVPVVAKLKQHRNWPWAECWRHGGYLKIDV